MGTLRARQDALALFQIRVGPDLIRNVLRGEYDPLDEPDRNVALYVEAVLDRTGSEAELGRAVRADLGEKAFIEIAFALASARFYPTVKRALGFATECGIGEFPI